MTTLDTSISFRAGRARHGYLYLKPRPIRVARSKPMGDGIIADFDDSGGLLGLELTAPQSFSAEAIDRALAALGHEGIDHDQLPSQIAWR